jgi:hypothetical protein
MRFVTVFFIFFSIAAQAEVGFKNGNQLTAVLSQGEITVQCDGDNMGGPTFGSFICQEEILLTGEYDYFQGPAGIKADEVTLTALHQDGSQRAKSSGYDSEKGQSLKSFNLWISTLLQRPLLDFGLNKISYKMTSQGQKAAEGEFFAQVKDGGRRICPRRGHYYSHISSDCQSGFSLCHRFFNENNYCL